MSNQTYFQNEWLEEDEFWSWVARLLDDNEKAKCKVCRKSFKLSNMGRGALTSHQTKCEKHMRLTKNLSTFLVKPKPKSAADNKRDSVNNIIISVVKRITKISSKQLLKLLWTTMRNLKLRLFGLWRVYLVVTQIVQVKTFQTYYMRCFKIAKLPMLRDLVLAKLNM